jgi:hypothetical protein
MLLVADSVQLAQRIPYQGSSWSVWRLQNKGKVIRIDKYSYDLVLLPKEETVLQGMIDRTIEIGLCYSMEMDMENLT